MVHNPAHPGDVIRGKPLPQAFRPHGQGSRENLGVTRQALSDLLSRHSR
jgi:hypothetical protein